jgi:hypothetical protein
MRPRTVRRAIGAIKVERRDRRTRRNIRRAFHLLALLPLARGSQRRVEIARQRHALLISPVVRPDILLIVRERGRRRLLSRRRSSWCSRGSLRSACPRSGARLLDHPTLGKAKRRQARLRIGRPHLGRKPARRDNLRVGPALAARHHNPKPDRRDQRPKPLNRSPRLPLVRAGGAPPEDGPIS